MSLNSSMHSEIAKTEQIVVDFFTESLDLILDSRVPSSFHGAGVQSVETGKDKWLNLASEVLEQWRQSMAGPVIVEVLYKQTNQVPSTSQQKKQQTVDQNIFLGGGYSPLKNTKRLPTGQEVIERWVLHYEPKNSSKNKGVRNQKLDPSKICNKTKILLRSLFSTSRLLPAYRLYRHLKSSDSSSDFSLAYKISFATNNPCVGDSELQTYMFTPIETLSGKLTVKVAYCSQGQGQNFTVTSVDNSLLSQIIPDYVRSPSSENLKRLSSDSSVMCGDKRLHPVNTNPTGTPVYTPFVRRHSWNGVIHKALLSPQSPLSPSHRLSSSPSVSPSQSNRRASPPSVPSSGPTGFQKFMPADHTPSPSSSPRPRLSAKACQSRQLQKAVSFDEQRVFSPFTPSPPSPSCEKLMLFGSAPVSIPPSNSGRYSRNWAPECCNPNRNSLPPLSPTSRRSDLFRKSQPTNCRAAVGAHYPGHHQFESQSPRRASFSKAEDCRIASNVGTTQKVSRDVNNESGLSQRFKSLPSETLLPRSSSRKSCQDEIEDEELPCPFALYDDEIPDWRSRTNTNEERHSDSGYSDTTGQSVTPRKSQGAAVGALVHILRGAQPLRSEMGTSFSPEKISTTASAMQKECNTQEVFIGASFSPKDTPGQLIYKTAVEALEELRSYKEIKESLLSQSGTRVVRKQGIII